MISTACAGNAGDPGPESEEWVVTRETEGNVTTVRNVSGSRWGGPATLREELSIGVLEGAEEYMFSGPSGTWLTDDEIYVLEGREHRVRVYDRQGRYLRSFGREGDGPGEFRAPRSIRIAPDGRIFVFSGMRSRRVDVLDREGNSLDTWALGQFTVGRFFTPLADGRFLVDAYRPPEGPMTGRMQPTVQEIATDGTPGALRDVPQLGNPIELTTTISGREMTLPALHSPQPTFAIASDGSLVTGFSDAYRFEIHHLDGRITSVSKHWEPVPVSDEQLDYEIALRVASMRRSDPGWDWPGGWRPDHKPAYTTILPDHSGRIWISRERASEPVAECTRPADWNPEAETLVPCWRADRVLDAFELDGSYLGELHRPPGVVFFSPFIRDDLLLASVEDEFGTILVKLYRIVLPDPETSP